MPQFIEGEAFPPPCELMPLERSDIQKTSPSRQGLRDSLNQVWRGRSQQDGLSVAPALFIDEASRCGGSGDGSFSMTALMKSRFAEVPEHMTKSVVLLRHSSPHEVSPCSPLRDFSVASTGETAFERQTVAFSRENEQPERAAGAAH